ncbi:hypothetical protein Agub_g10747 [Astrephomene gubernaculifera]|uniref:HotDog ACOT-type domain-containing protein n=1 Tax=Astrephomene gubernaculifera TaxID=47775 RepID=A0AAD3DX68_9CHLO|nr:hypothetical protein Agub_g10747 [Astrephomene gubernaculifera]
MISTLRIEEPQALKKVPLEEAKFALPFSYEVGESRRGGSRGLVVRYKPRNEDPEASEAYISWAVKAREAAAAASAAAKGAAAASPGASNGPQSAAAAASGASTDAAVATKPTVAAKISPQQRAPSDSYLELVFPFSSSKTLREQYQRFTSNNMRFGLLLEDLDTLAGDIAARHAGMEGKVLLTASIDRISWLKDPSMGEVSLAHDLRMAGQVVWAGRSSMEVLIEVSYQLPGAAQWNYMGRAFFVLVARTPDRKRAAEIPALTVQTARERELFMQGQLHMRQRQQRRDSHWARKAPTVEEIAIIHDLIRTHHFSQPATASSSNGQSLAAPANIVPMRRTVLENSCLMHTQDRNVWDVIFGGHLLRLAYEHAFATAALHAGVYCQSLSMDDVAYLLPVPIGALLRLTGQVVFVDGPVIRVHVRASKVEPGAPEQGVTTNMFSFAFMCPSGPVRRVVPDTMVEAMEYVMAHRQHAADGASQQFLEALAMSKL